ncbi:MAG: hypothetical protein E7467_05130 [Ruminococcaceae bacterium]|nr:hypothetical protein [Oscillospiraceae bacterium]
MSYCGRDCNACANAACAGCQKGPGHRLGDCQIAKCCHNRMIGGCNFCGANPCLRHEQRRDPSTPDPTKAKFMRLSKQLMVLFWLHIAGEIIAILNNDWLPELIGKILSLLSFAVSVTLIVFFFLLGKSNTKFRMAGILYICINAIALIAILLLSQMNPYDDGLYSALSLINYIVLFLLAVLTLLAVAQCIEIKAHVEMLHRVDGYMADKWEGLYKRYLICYIGGTASIVILTMLWLSTLVEIVLFGVMIFGIVNQITYLVYLHQTAKCFDKASKYRRFHNPNTGFGHMNRNERGEFVEQPLDTVKADRPQTDNMGGYHSISKIR